MHPVVQRLLLLLRGGRQGRHVFPAVLLGAVAGTVCGWNLTFVLLVLAAVVVNGPLAATLVSFVVALVASRAAATLVVGFGKFLLEKLGLGVVVESLGHGPIVGLLGWHDYHLVGGAVSAICLSLPAAHALSLRTVRRSYAMANSSTSSADSLLRPSWLPLAGVVVVAAFVLTSVVGPKLVGQALLAQWSAAVGSEVSAENIAYDLWKGDLRLAGLRIADGADSGRAALRIDRVTAHVDAGLLLRGCIECDNAVLSGIECDAPPRPASVYGHGEPTFLREDESSKARTASAGQPLDATRFIGNWHDIESRLLALQGIVAGVELVADLETPPMTTRRLRAVPRPRMAPRDPLSGRNVPLVQIKHITVEGLPDSWSLGPEANLEITNVASRPGTSARASQLTLDSTACRARLIVGFRLNVDERRHDVMFSWENGNAATLIDARRATAAGLDVSYAQIAAIRGRGWITRDALELPLSCEVRGVVPTASAGRFGDIDGAVWNEGVTRLGGLRFDVALSAEAGRAKLHVVPAAMVDQLKHQLRSAGEHALVKSVERGRMPEAVAASPTPRTIAPTATTPMAAMTPSVAATPVQTTVQSTAQPTTVAAVSSVPSPTKVETPQPAATPVAAASAVVQATTPSATSTATPTSTHNAPPVVTAAATVVAAQPTAPPAKSVETAKSPRPSAAIASATAVATDLPASTTQTVAPIPTPVAGQSPAPSQVASRPAQVADRAVLASSLEELRQPAGIVETSAMPGMVQWRTGYDSSQAIAAAVRKPSPPAAVAAAAPTATAATATTGLSNLTQPKPPVVPPSAAQAVASAAAARSSPSPSRSTPQTPSQTSPSNSTAAPKPSLLAKVGDWFAPDEAERNAAPQRPTQPERRATTGAVPPESATAAKPYFPRLRALWEDDAPAADIAPQTSLPSPSSPTARDTELATPRTSVQRRSTITNELQPFEPEPPQTVREPWYDRVFR